MKKFRTQDAHCIDSAFKTLVGLGIFLGSFLMSSDTLAKSDLMIVRKAKGKNAIVQFKTLAPKKGEKFSVSPSGSDEGETTSDEGGSAGGSRDKTIAFASSLSVQGGFKMNVTSQYGWNMGSYEIGPVLNLSMTAGSFGLLGGVFADINFSKNKAPASTIIGVGLKGTFDLGSKAIAVSAGVPFKLFILGSSTTALRIAPDVTMTFLNGSSIGFGLNAGLQVYF